MQPVGTRGNASSLIAAWLSSICLSQVFSEQFEFRVRNFVKMAKLLLLSDSNFSNNYGDYSGRKIKELEVKSCQSRRAAMLEIGSAEEGIIVVACLDMVAADVVKTTPVDADRAVEVYYNQLLLKMVEKIDDADGKIAFGVVAPMFWSSLPLPVRRSMSHTYKLMKLAPLNRIWFTDFKKAKAGADGTHLTRNSASHYIKQVQDLFGLIGESTGLGPVVFLEPEPATSQGAASNATPTDWSEDVSMEDEDAVHLLEAPEEEDGPAPTRTTTMLSASILLPPSRQVTTLFTGAGTTGGVSMGETQARLMRLAAPAPDFTIPPPTLGGMQAPPQAMYQAMQQGQYGLAPPTLEHRVAALESITFYNNLTMAALKEDQDAEANRAMLNRVTFSGVVIAGLEKMAEPEKIKAMREKVTEIIDSLKEPDQVFEIQFVRHLNNQVRGQTSSVIEAKLADAKQAKTLRSEYVKKYKSLADKINITPVVRLATRVRVEMLHSIAQLLKRRDPSVVSAMCVQFIPKPVIRVVRKSYAGNQFTRSMSFIEAVTWVKEQGLERALDLNKAYDRAGASSRSTRSQTYVLLH